MTFIRQIQTVRLLLVLLAVLAAAPIVLSIVNQQWASLAVALPVVAVLGWLIHIQWRLVTRQRGIADLAEQLRAVSHTVPAGMDRVYSSVLSTTVVHLHPNIGSGFDQFSQFDSDDMDNVDHAQAGDTVSLPAVTYRVRRSFPLVWRQAWADQAVKTSTPGKYAPSPRPATNYRDVIKVLLLNHRTGVLIPDRADLTELLHRIENADHTRDIPRTAK